MDEDEFDSSEDDALGRGKAVIVTTDSGYETGILMGSGEAGVRLTVTHRAIRVEPTLSEVEKLGCEAVVKGMSARMLYQGVRESVGVRALWMSREDLEAIVLAEVLEAELAARPTVEMLKPLTRPVSTMIPWGTIEKVVSFSEWEEEQVLRPYDASLDASLAANTED